MTSISQFGIVPPSDEELVREYLGKDVPFRFSGPDYWNPLRLGTTALFAYPLVYNEKHDEMIEVKGRKFLFKKEKFPSKICVEWLIIDLLNNAGSVGSSINCLLPNLIRKISDNFFNKEDLICMMNLYGNKEVKEKLLPLFI